MGANVGRLRTRATQLDDLLKQSLGCCDSDRAKSLTLADQALQLDSNNHSAHFRRGYALAALNRNDEAEAAYYRYIELCPTGDSAFNNRATIRHNQGRLDEALSDYSQAVKLLPSDPLYLRNRANILVQLHRYELAIAD